MRIALIDIDNITSKPRFPNVALMKLSAFHKAIGDQVEWYSIDGNYDIVYGSQVFDFSMPMPSIPNTEKVILGGVAIGLNNKLPTEVEGMYPDYSIYDFKEAYGFLTRGCPRNCHFCNVTQHQGSKAIKVADLSDFWTNQKEIKLLDPNMYASKDWRICNDQLEESKAKIDFTQGVDIRVMTKDKVDAINRLKVKMIHFAWDNYEFATYKKLVKYRDKFNLSGRNMSVYVLTNFNTTHEQDVERIMKLRELDYDPYMMIFDKFNAPKRTRKMQRWVNNKILWRSCNTFNEYLKYEEKPIDGQLTLF